MASENVANPGIKWHSMDNNKFNECPIMFEYAAIGRITTTMKKAPLSSSSSTLAICSETKLIAINILWPNRFSQRRKISGESRLRRFKFFACKRFGRNLNFKLIFLTILKHSWLKRFFWSILFLKLSPISSSFISIVNFTVCCPFNETVANTVHVWRCKQSQKFAIKIIVVWTEIKKIPKTGLKSFETLLNPLKFGQQKV